MKRPQTPPLLRDHLKNLTTTQQLERLPLLVGSPQGMCDNKGRYLHWDKVKHLTPPTELTVTEFWLAMKYARQASARTLPFIDEKHQPFWYAVPDSLMRDLLWIEKHTTGSLEADPRITDDKTKRTYLLASLMEESITSSQLEGASTSRRQAKELLKTGRAPKDHSERMIMNNHRAMKFIQENRAEPLTPALIFELHRILTENTLEPGDADKAGAFRDVNDDICVFSREDDSLPLHIPPKAVELPERLQRLCDFANAENSPDEQGFIPTVIRAVTLHFMIGFDHPFVDGNGRTARALFYWMMARERYWLMEYVSISRVLKKAPSKYMQAYLHTETDGNDLTYFLIHQLSVIKEAINDLYLYLEQRNHRMKETASLLKSPELQGQLNHRQLALLQHALRNPGMEYTTQSHRGSHGVTQQTARTDLLALSDKYQLLRKLKVGKTDIFIVPSDLEERLQRLP
ncbi:MAG: filamentation induced by cAMP protein fic [Pseudomonas sp.]|nr:filamentation induced by cAMP protein fic [Pseudomonas sp.]